MSPVELYRSLGYELRFRFGAMNRARPQADKLQREQG
jgi:hypothetical protein